MIDNQYQVALIIMPRVFISYRRDDSLGFTGRIFDRLKSHFGSDSVVMDVDSIPFGADFIQYITDAIRECDVLLAVIGDRWLGPESDITKRLDDPRDFVRLEIETALNQGVPLIPVLVGTTPMPREDELPAPLKKLASRNAISIDAGRDFHHHVDRLIQTLDRLPSNRKVQAPQESLSSDHSVTNEERPRQAVPSTFQQAIDIVSGPEQGRSFELIKDRILIGRAHDSDISLSTPLVSRYHAQLVRLDEGYEFEDLKTTNGSYVNGSFVSGRLRLKDGDRIHVGQTILVYRSRR